MALTLGQNLYHGPNWDEAHGEMAAIGYCKHSNYFGNSGARNRPG